VHLRRRCVARSAAVDDRDAAPGAPEDEGGTEPCRSAANYDYVIAFVIHGRDAAERRRTPPLSLLIPGRLS
jgi:hypothetical protein